MAFDYINEAFKKLDLLEEKMFDTSLNGINELSNFLDNDDTEEIIRVIDPEAETDEDVQDSYIGKVIVNCNICHSHVFENKEDIKIEEDGAVNVETRCPYCGETEGFVIVGEIAPYADPKVTVDGEEVPVETKEDSADDADEIELDLDDEQPEEDTDSEEEQPEEDDRSKNESVKMSRATRRIAEDFKEVSVTTGDQHMEMSSDDSGKVTITTEPVTEATATSSVIAPISDDTQEEILDNNVVEEEPVEEEPLEGEAEETPVEEEPAEEPTEESAEESAEEETEEEPIVEESFDTSVDVEFDEIDESGVDTLCENYLKRVYENVRSFKTTDVSANDNNLVVEGVIEFASGAKKNTGFIFEACDINENSRIRFKGYNKHFTESKDAFSLVGVVDNKKLFVESLKYDYTVNNNTVRGVARRK